MFIEVKLAFKENDRNSKLLFVTDIKSYNKTSKNKDLNIFFLHKQLLTLI